MFYKVKLSDHIRVPPNLFGKEVKEAILTQIQEKYHGYISKDLGTVIEVKGIQANEVGKIVPGDGAAYYKTDFEVLTFRPELQEVLFGRIRNMADFGAFLSVGPMDAMIHISQTMDDFVSLSKEKVLQARDTKKILKVGDDCRARVISVSFKDLANPKIGVTMRQAGLGKLEWLEEPKKEAS